MHYVPRIIYVTSVGFNADYIAIKISYNITSNMLDVAHPAYPIPAACQYQKT